jgi:predicted nucleic-acid-binding protein
VLTALIALTESPELEMQDGLVIARALWFFGETNSQYDFADCLHLSETLSAEKDPFLTFDVKASQLPGALLCGAQ